MENGKKKLKKLKNIIGCHTFQYILRSDVMPRKKGNSQGSIYYNKQRDNWIVQRYEYDYETGKNKKLTKTFYTKEEAQKYLDSIMYQQSNPLYIKNNGIPLAQLMKANAQKKLDTNLISENLIVSFSKLL